MKRSRFSQKIYSYLLSSYQWYLQTPERSLDEAYKAALLIKAMEDSHFNGQKVAPDANYGASTMAYFQAELKKHLKTIDMRLTEFRASRSFVGEPNQTITKISRSDATNPGKVSFAIESRNNSPLVLERLRFIDDVVARYAPEPLSYSSLVPVTDPIKDVDSTNPTKPRKSSSSAEADSLSEGTEALPRSILNTFDRIRIELKPKAEKEVIKNFRNSRQKTLSALRLIVLLIIVPLLTHKLSKVLVVGPIVDHFRSPGEPAVFLNLEMEEEALAELEKFEQRLNFQNLISEAPKFTPEEIKEQLKDKAQEITKDYRGESSGAVKNVFADLLSLGAFGLVIFFSKREVAILKSFMDDIVYGLSDSAKAFIIILFTDMFVGFHSPHGWEVLLSGVSRHLGLPENHDFIFLFIATFPVILDTIFKYWIFRYLNRTSPSAVATYRNMNE